MNTSFKTFLRELNGIFELKTGIVDSAGNNLFSPHGLNGAARGIRSLNKSSKARNDFLKSFKHVNKSSLHYLRRDDRLGYSEFLLPFNNNGDGQFFFRVYPCQINKKSLKKSANVPFRHEKNPKKINGNHVALPVCSENFLKSYLGILRNFAGKENDLSKSVSLEKEKVKEIEALEKHYRDLINLSPEAIIVHSDGRFLYLNKSALKLFGARSVKELKGRKVIEFIHPDYVKLVAKRFSLITKSKVLPFTEAKFISLDGKTVTVEVYAMMIYFNKKPVVQAIMRDVSHLSKAEQALRESEERFRTISGITSDYAYSLVISPDNTPKMEWATGSIRNVTGFNMRNIPVGKKYFKIIHPDDSCIVRKEYSELLNRKSTVNEYRIIKKNGKIVWIQNKAYPVYDNTEKRVVRIIGVIADITERKIAEEKIRRSEEQFSKAFTSSPFAISISDLETGRIIDVNECYQTITGFGKNELINKSPADLNMWINHGKRNNIRRTLENTGSLRGIETNFKMKSGDIRSWRSSLEVIEIAGRKCILSLIEDITERKHTLEALKESENRYRVFIDSSDDMAYLKDSDFRYIILNKSNADFFGKKVSDIIGKTDFELMPFEEAEKCRQSDISAMNSNQVHVENEYVKGRIYETHKFRVPLSKNNFGVGGYIRDVTEQRIAETRIRKSEANLSLAQRIADMGSWEYDIATGNAEWSDNMLRIFGVKRENSSELLLDNFLNNILHPDDREILLKTLEDAVKGLGNYDIEYRILRKDGLVRDIQAKAELIRKPDGTPEKLIGWVQDITERKFILQSLVEAKEKAVEMNRVKSNFFSTMSHELRTPMTGILGFAEILSSKIEDEECKNMAKVILNAGNRLLHTLNLILDITKIESDRLTVKNEILELSEIVKESAYLFNASAREKNLELIIDLEENVFALVDEKLLRQSVSNLIKNSILYTQSGSVKVNLIKENSNGCPKAVIKVTDTGIGIPKDMLEVIFEPFRQVSEGWGRKFEGTGLGLSITKKFIEKMGGEISVESVINKGSVFSVVFPAQNRPE
ncbi:MAG: PAS domain S-box protein [Bacteroidetes bacterium]|nr:PAS domain S-box protein [Bacteroidota bacterium]